MSNKILFQISPGNETGTEDPDMYGIAYPTDASTTVPTNKEWIIESLQATNLFRGVGGAEGNVNNSPLKYKIHICKAGDGPEAKNCIAYYPPFNATTYQHIYRDIRMSEGDKVIVYVQGGRMSFQAFGKELDETADAEWITTMNAIQNISSAVTGGVLHTNTIVNVTCNCA